MTGDVQIVAPRRVEEWAAYYALRWRLLRAPWGQPPGSERDGSEDGALHLAALRGGEVVGVGRLHRLDRHTGQIRYMAVAEDARGQGIGRALLQALERGAAGRGIRRIVLDAREGAVPFYRRHGYAVVGEAHTLFGSIRHLRMARDLSARPEGDRRGDSTTESGDRTTESGDPTTA